MQIKTKIYLNIALWVVATFAMFQFVLPKFSNGLVALQSGHQQQLNTLAKLKVQAAGLEKMRQDLDTLQKEKVQPQDFFSNDLRLVSEIKKIEDNASRAGVTTNLTIPESTDKAKPLKDSQSGLLAIPYTLQVAGDLPSLLKFLNYMENSFFVSQFSAVSSLLPLEKSLQTQLNGTFYINKNADVLDIQKNK